MLKKLISLALVGTMLASCGNGATESTAKPDSTNSGEVTTIRFWDGSWNEESFAQINAIWEKENPNIKVVPEFQVDKGMSDKYMLALKNGTAPDVVACALDWVTTFGSADLLAPLDEFIANDNIDVSQYVKGAVDASTVNGSLYGLPFRSETYALYYNKDLLKEAGYDEPPKTWDEVLEIAKATTKGDVSGYGLTGTNYSNFSFQYINMLFSSGGDLLSEDYSQSALDSDVALQTAETYKELQQYAPSSLLENDNIANRTLFASGKVAMYMSGIYDVPEIIKSNPDLNFACAMIPTANNAERKSLLGGWSVAIPKSSKNQEAAFEFVKFLTRPDIAAIYSNTFTGTAEPAVRFEGVNADIIEPNAEALQYAVALPSVPQIVGIRQAIYDNLVLMLSNDKTPEEAIQLTNDSVNALLK